MSEARTRRLPRQIGGFVALAALGTVARLLMFLMIYAALPRLRARAGERALLFAVAKMAVRR